MNVIVLIGDLVASRRSRDRAELQTTLQEVLDELNQANGTLLSPYTLTLGDEFQAVFRQAEGLFGDMLHLLRAIQPHQVRLAVGIGALDTPLNRKQAIGMDGPAFHRARDGISRLKDSGRRLTVEGIPDAAGDLLRAGLNLVSDVMDEWQQNRFEVLDRWYRNTPVKEIARQMPISNTSVYKNIRDGKLEPIRDILRQGERLIDAALRESP